MNALPEKAYKQEFWLREENYFFHFGKRDEY